MIKPQRSKPDFLIERFNIEMEKLAGKKENKNVNIPITQVIQDKEFP